MAIREVKVECECGWTGVKKVGCDSDCQKDCMTKEGVVCGYRDTVCPKCQSLGSDWKILKGP